MADDAVGTRAILSVTNGGDRWLLAFFVFVNVALAGATINDVYRPVPTIVSLVLISAAATLLTRPVRDPLPLRRSIVILTITTAVTVLSDANIPPDAPPGFSTWHYASVTLVLFILGLRGRSVLAWVGFFAVVAVTIAWTLMTGSTLLLELLPNQAATLAVGTVFAVGLRNTSKRIWQLQAEQTALAAAESASLAAAEERARQAARLNAVARPALERIAAGPPYSDEERESWMRLEATVRDSLRAPSLNLPQLAAAADGARARGVEVTLLDDSAGELESSTDREVIATAIIAELDTMDSGRLTGRVLPRGRGQLATIVVDDEDGETSRQIVVEE
jgi:hypothetical protein